MRLVIDWSSDVCSSDLVLEEEHAERLARETGVAPEVGARDAADGEAELCELLLTHLAHGVARGDVADLVAYHAAELGLGVQVGQDATGDVDVAAGEGEGVDHRIVHDVEGPRQVGSLRGGREPRAELLDPALPRGVGVEPDGRGDLLVVVAAHRDLLRLADQHELPRPGGGVDGAAGGPEGAEHGQPCAPAPGDESGHGSKDTRLTVRELPLRPPTVYGAAHETARAEEHPGHRASRPSGGGARRLAHPGLVEKTDRLRCPSVSNGP